MEHLAPNNANDRTEKLSSIVRSVSMNNESREHRSNQNTPVSWDSQAVRDRPRSRESNSRPKRDSRESQPQLRDSKESQRERVERYGGSQRQQQHVRDGSGGTVQAQSADFAEPHSNYGGRRHDYDVQSMETDLSSPRQSMPKHPLPPPIVTIRSEFPTLTRSRQQQTLTCLVTIEVPEGKWSPDPEDLKSAPVLPSMQPEPHSVRPRSPAPTRQSDARQSNARQPNWPFESPEVLEAVTEDLRRRVDDWHGLDVQRCDRSHVHPFTHD